MRFNNFTLTGMVTHTPSIRYTAGGMAVITLHLKAEHVETSKDQPAPIVQVTFFGPVAEALQDTEPETFMLVQGSIKLEQWTKGGARKTKIVLIGKHAHEYAPPEQVAVYRNLLKEQPELPAE